MVEMLAAAALTLALDIGSKRMVEARLTQRVVALGSTLELRHVSSRRPRYQRNATKVLLTLFWLAAFVSIILLNVFGNRIQSSLALIGAGIALGGAAGNLADIVTRQAVTDFIDFKWWPAFNLADVAILGGLALALWPAR